MTPQSTDHTKEEKSKKDELSRSLSEKEKARSAGFSGDMCATCGNFTMVRAGTCLTCITCGSTTGCS